jgi:hypothetical protein
MFKKHLRFVGLTLVSSFFLLGSVPAVMAQNWQSMTQPQRNQAIISTAEGVNDSKIGTFGGPCKVFVQNVVSTASKGAVWVPSNSTTNYYQWNLLPGDNVIQMSPTVGPINLLALQPGWILQLERANNAGPHTAIVVMVSTSGIVLLDSNWVGPANSQLIGMHTMLWSAFNSAFVRLTAYEIT